MKLKHIAFFIISTVSLAGFSQTSATRQAHQQAHQHQLANVKKGMDKSVINGFIKEDIAKREAAAEKTLSAASETMLNDLLKEANRHIGKRYQRGAKGPTAFDCSGFSSYVYRQFGYSISSSSRSQYNEGIGVKRNELRKGDLVFFTSRGSGKNIGHVGIVVSADNATGKFKFIHASNSGVTISGCDGYYAGRYVGARRIITE